MVCDGPYDYNHHWPIMTHHLGTDLTFDPTEVSHSTLLQFRPHTVTFDPTLNDKQPLQQKRPLAVHIRPYLILLVHTTGETCFRNTPPRRVGWGGMLTFPNTCKLRTQGGVGLGWGGMGVITSFGFWHRDFMLRYETFSCSCTPTWCHSIRSSPGSGLGVGWGRVDVIAVEDDDGDADGEICMLLLMVMMIMMMMMTTTTMMMILELLANTCWS